MKLSEVRKAFSGYHLTVISFHFKSRRSSNLVGDYIPAHLLCSIGSLFIAITRAPAEAMWL